MTNELPLRQIIQGDCLQVMRDFPDESIDLVVTDPPYNVLTIDDIKIKKKKFIRRTDFEKDGLLISSLMSEICRLLRDGGTFYIFCADRQIGKYVNVSEAVGLRYSNTLIWYDPSSLPSVRKRAYSNHTQYIAFGHKEINEKYIFNWKGERNMGNLLDFNACVSFEYGKNPGEWVGHPTQKPSLLIRHLIEISSNEDDLVLDPFLGSGTTAIVAEKLRRKWIGIELNPEYCEIARKRLRPWLNQTRLDVVEGMELVTK